MLHPSTSLRMNGINQSFPNLDKPQDKYLRNNFLQNAQKIISKVLKVYWNLEQLLPRSHAPAWERIRWQCEVGYGFPRGPWEPETVI